MSGDIRRYPRNVAACLVSYSHYAPDQSIDDQGMGRLCELSLAGAAFECNHAFSQGSHIEMEVQLRNDIVKIAGPIVSITALADDEKQPGASFRIGVSIEKASPNYADVLREYFA